MSVSGLLNIGMTALFADNEALSVTANNVANANTPGYTRQQAVFSSVTNGTISSSGETGNGVQVSSITRLYDTFVNQQLNTENSNLSYWNNFQSGMSTVQNVFNEASTTGISPAITNFYNAWQSVSQDPSDTAPRTTLIQNANYLSSRLSGAYTALDGERAQLLTDSQSLAGTVNTTTAEIAGLNAKIAGNPGALDLQDQRDNLMQTLNSIVKVSSFQDNSGMVTVLVGGTPIVQGAKSFNMSANSDAADNMHFYVAINPTAVPGTPDNPDVTSSVSGGQLAANLDLRDTTIPAYVNQLNAFAVNLADTTNYYQKQGYGLDGQPGSNFFTPLSQTAKYTSVDSSAGVFTSQNETFSTSGGTLTVKLGDNDATPATVKMASGGGTGTGGAWTLNDVVNAINAQAGSKVSASVVSVGPASQFTVTNANDTFKTEVGGVWTAYTVPAGTYTAAGLASTINGLGAGISVSYDTVAHTFSVASATGGGGASQLDVTAATSIGSLIGFSGSPAIGTASIVGTVPEDNRISIKSNPDGNLGSVSIAVTALNGPPYDTAGSGLNLLATGTVTAANSSSNAVGAPTLTSSSGTIISSTSVTDAASLDPNAQYKIDYSYTSGAGYQQDGNTGMYWRVMKSDDGGGTWATINPNTSFNPSVSSTTNESEVNLTGDPSGLSRTLEFEGIKVQIDGKGINSTTNPNGETFDVQLDPHAAEDIATSITNPNQVAASTDTWTVGSSNNSVVFNVTTNNVNSGPITAVIPSGSYTNDPGQSDDISGALTSAMQAAYQAATGSALTDTLNVVFNPNTKQFNITMPSGGDSINLQWSNTASTANQVFGFSNDTSLNSFAITAGHNTIVYNDGTADRTATISTAGSPYTGVNLATAIQTALNTAPGTLDTVFSVTYNSDGTFTINNGPTAPATATIKWNSGTVTPQQFGFAPVNTANIPVGGSVSSAEVGNSVVSDNPASVYSSANNGVPGDNRNATAIANVANGTSFGGTTPIDFYNSLVSNVGIEASSANSNQTFQSTLVTQLTQQQQQVSGVSMDEEASNLVVYQQSYQAAAKLITVADQLLTTLMNMVGGTTSTG